MGRPKLPEDRRPAKDLTGQRFATMVVTGFAGFDRWRKARWNYKCDCGREATTDEKCLRRMKSCGCVRKRTTTHGMSNSKEYRVWRAMLNRCENTNVERFPQYGGRGIRVCERWHKFENFLMDMGRRPSPKMQIDRIENDGNYEPGNVRWATPKQQLRNRSDNRILEYNHKKMCINDWATETSLKRECIAARLKMGWSVEKSLTTPARPLRKVS